MSTAAMKRLMKDLKRMQNDPPPGISAAPEEDNILVWDAIISGPEGTPWEGGAFRLIISFSTEYPIEPPMIEFFRNSMFHPNIYDDGSICLNILDDDWSPVYDIAAALISIQSMLNDPNTDSPANVQAAQLFNENKNEYNRRVREIVDQSWKPD